MLDLYQAKGCPYSETVREKTPEIGLSCDVHDPRLLGGDVQNEQMPDEQLALGESDQVPLLVDHQHGITMHESDEIVDYLDERYG